MLSIFLQNYTFLSICMALTRSPQIGQLTVLGQNGIGDKMVRTKWYGQNGTIEASINQAIQLPLTI